MPPTSTFWCELLNFRAETSFGRYASVALMHTVTYGSARPFVLANAGWVASRSRTRSSVRVRTFSGEVMQ